MDKKRRLIYLEIALIIVLLLFCIVLNGKSAELKRDCKVQYDINGSCPCINPNPKGEIPNFGNITKYLNISNN